MTSIGQTIRYYRLMAGWSQAKLAEVAGVSVISVRRYEEETGEQTIKTLRKIEYSDGYKRVGCVGCPLSSKCNRMRGFEEYPTYKRAYIRAFDKMLDVRKTEGLQTEWKNGEEVFEWWVNS